MSDRMGNAAIRAGRATFDPQTRLLDVAGRKTVLDARSSRVFLTLTEHFGNCVSKDKLLLAGWPTQLVHENSLAKAISKLRRAIEGSGVEIAANYGVGYTLRNSDSSAATDPVSPEAPPATRKRAPTRRYTVLLVGTCAVLLTTAVTTLVVDRFGQPVPVRRTLPITNDPANATATILWVDDHPSNNALEIQALRQRRVAVHLTTSTDDALTLLAINRYKLVVSDLGRGEDRLAGLKMITTMRERGITVPVIIYTIRPKDRSGQERLRLLAAGAGASDLAVTPEQVRASISRRLVPT